MSAEVTMPQLSDTMTEGTVVKWYKKEGDKVRNGEQLADVETDKAVMAMEAFDSGTLAFIKIKEGEKVSVGGVLAIIATGSESIEEIKMKFAAGAAAPAKSSASSPSPSTSRKSSPAPPASTARSRKPCAASRKSSKASTTT